MALLKNSFIALLCVVATSGFSQHTSHDLTNCKLQSYKGGLFLAGIKPQSNTLMIYRLNAELRSTDSLTIGLKENNGAQFLPIYSDTLHGYLNFYIQKKDDKQVSIIRLKSPFTLAEQIDKVDVARLNNSAMLGKDPLFWGPGAYAIVKEKDSSGTQYYVNRYDLKSNSGNFDYRFVWQFPFEKKDIQHARIIAAEQRHIYVYTYRSQAGQVSQWLLKINCRNGELIKAIKIGEKGDQGLYCFAAASKNASTGELIICGQLLQSSDTNLYLQKSPKYPAGTVKLWMCIVDSNAAISSRETFSLQFGTASSPKGASEIGLVRMNLVEQKNTEIKIDFDLYTKAVSENCFRYGSSGFLNITKKEEQWTTAATSLGVQPDLVFYYKTIDKLDRNASLCPQGLSLQDLFTDALIYPARVAYKMDENNKGKWLLKKTDSRKKQWQVAGFKNDTKTYKLTVLENLPLEARPQVLNVTETRFILGWQSCAEKFETKVYIW